MISKHEKRIDEIAKIAMRIKDAVAADYYTKIEKEEEVGLKGIDYMPTSLDIAKYYGIRYKFKKTEGDVPAYLEIKSMLIYISEKYRGDNYAIRQLVAHELGHFFLHKKKMPEMNIFPHRVKEEYEANIFSIFLMPQIVKGEPWENLPPRTLNRKLYDKVFKKDD